MSTVSTSSPAYHHGNLRQALIDAGIAQLDHSDGKDLSLRELARQTGVSPSAVYRHFPSKEALLAALARHGLELLGASQSAANDAAGGGAAGFTAIGRAYVRFALANPALFRLIFTHGRPDGAHDSDPDSAWILLGSSSAELAGGSGPEAERLALQAWSIGHGVAMLMLDGRLPADDLLIDRLIDTSSLFPARQGSSSEESP